MSGAWGIMVGAACIGSSSGAIPEVVGSGGLIFSEKDVDGLTSALEKVIRSETFRGELGRKARTVALERYTNAVVASAYLTSFCPLRR